MAVWRRDWDMAHVRPDPAGREVSFSQRLATIPTGRRTKWVVLGAWVFLAGVAFAFGPRLSGEQVNDASTFLPRTAESTQVIALQQEFGSGDVIPAVVVYERASGITPADRAAAQADRAAFSGVERVQAPIPPVLPSKDGKALQVVVPIDAQGDVTALTGAIDSLRAIAVDADGLTVRVAGPAATTGDFLRSFQDLNTTLLLFTVLVVVIVLLVTYRSPILWIVPLLSVLVAAELAQAANWVLAKNGTIIVNGQTVSILLVLVFGAGTDYALLLISRYREELRRFDDRHDAMREALTRSAGAISASAFTVAAALLMLRFSSLESTRGLGPAAALGILCALIATLTLLPTLLVVVGRWVFWPFVPRVGDASRESSGFWVRVGGAVSRRPRPIWVGTALVLAAVALGATALDATGLPTREAFRSTVPSVEGQDLIARHFDAGQGAPLVIVGEADEAAVITRTAAGVPGIAEIGNPVVRGRLVKLEATLGGSTDPAQAYPVVRELRAALAQVPGSAKVGGDIAVDADTSAAAARDRHVVIPLVLLVVLLILVVILRAVVAPVMLIATVVLSFFATLGLCTLLFSWLLDSTRGDLNYPLFAFIFLVALGVDYNIFLMTRVREEAQQVGTHDGVLRGLAVTGGVITSAAVVLAATFAVLASLPVTALFQIGVTVSIGVLLDAIVVRSVLVPALSLDVGRRIWWPSRLWRLDGPDEGASPTAQAVAAGDAPF